MSASRRNSFHNPSPEPWDGRALWPARSRELNPDGGHPRRCVAGPGDELDVRAIFVLDVLTDQLADAKKRRAVDLRAPAGVPAVAARTAAAHGVPRSVRFSLREVDVRDPLAVASHRQPVHGTPATPDIDRQDAIETRTEGRRRTDRAVVKALEEFSLNIHFAIIVEARRA